MVYFPIRLFIKILFAQNSRIYHSVIISIHTICKLHKLRRRISFILMQLFVYQNGSYIALTITRNAGKATGFSFEKSEYCHLMHCFVDLIFKFPFEFHILRIPGLGLMALEWIRCSFCTTCRSLSEMGKDVSYNLFRKIEIQELHLRAWCMVCAIVCFWRFLLLQILYSWRFYVNNRGSVFSYFI